MSNIHRVLISLDCLLDTRMGALSQVSPGYADALWRDERYWERLVDDFDPFCGAGATLLYEERYRRRDLSTLKASRMTHAILELRRICSELEYAIVTDPELEGAEIHINLDPYEMPEEDAEDIRRWVAIDTLGGIPVYTTRVSLKDLTIAAIREHWDLVILYDFNAWLDIQTPSFRDGERAPRKNMIVPGLFRNRLPKPEDLVDIHGRKRDPFEETKKVMTEFVSLNFWPAVYFSHLRAPT